MNQTPQSNGMTKRPNILFICGSINQTTQMHQISQQLPEANHWFTPYYADGFTDWLRRSGLAEMSVLGNKHRNRCLGYLKLHDLSIDDGGRLNDYDLVVTCSDLVVPSNILNKRVVLVQEGMTDPEEFWYHVVKTFRFLPRWLASTATTGLSHSYDRFCVASEGYRQLFMRKGVNPGKIVVTGIPNFDNMKRFLDNDFPYRNFVLVCTSDSRETFKYENRKAFILDALRLANGRQLIFKLHPNENVERATREINRWAPGALVYTSGSAEHMIANCSVLITKYSSTVYVGIALGKEVYSWFDLDELRSQCPDQHGRAAQNIAAVCREVLGAPSVTRQVPRKRLLPDPVKQLAAVIAGRLFSS